MVVFGKEGGGGNAERMLVERGGASVSASLTRLIVRLSSRLQTDAGAESGIRESHQRGGARNECRQLRCKLGGKKLAGARDERKKMTAGGG